MKKLITAVLVITISLSMMTACGTKPTDNKQTQQKQAAQETQEVKKEEKQESIYIQSPLWSGIFKQYYDKCGTATYDEVVPQIKTLGLNVDDSYRSTQLNIGGEIAVNVTDPNLPEYIGMSLYFDENDKLYFIEYMISSSTFMETLQSKSSGMTFKHIDLETGEESVTSINSINEASGLVSKMFEPCDNAAQIEYKYQ